MKSPSSLPISIVTPHSVLGEELDRSWVGHLRTLEENIEFKNGWLAEQI